MPSHDTDVFNLFAEIYSREKQEEISLQEYLLACRDDPSMYASAPERMMTAIGEPRLVDTSADERLGRIFANRTIKIYPAFADFYGMEETVERIVSYFRHAAQGLEERKQILYLLGPVGGGKSSLAERLKRLMEEQPIYTLKIGDEISPVFEFAAGPVPSAAHGRPAGRQVRRREAQAYRPDFALGDQASRRDGRRHLQVLRRQDHAVQAAPDRNRQDRARRREQPGRLLAGRQGRHPAARAFQPGRSGCLFLQRRPQPHDAGAPGIRRDVQGADQGAASAADGDPGGQLQRHGELRRVSLPGHRAGAFQRVGMAAVQEQQEQRGLPRPHPGGQGAVLPARDGGEADLREAASRKRARQQSLRAGSAGDPEPLHGVDAACRARELAALHQDAGL